VIPAGRAPAPGTDLLIVSGPADRIEEFASDGEA
jgi:hypothetical protein